MMKYEGANNPERLLLGSISDYLAAKGFKRRRQVFTRVCNDVLQLINYQKSTSSSSGHIICTVNVGIYSSTLATALGEDAITNDIWQSHWYVRLGHLSPSRDDKWWTISNSSDASFASFEIVNYIEEYALPVFEHIDSTEKLIQLWKGGTSPGLTAFQVQKYLSVLSTA